jgi:farnesyl-diphosphate farnesyltransferase
MTRPATPKALLGPLLKDVSRSFYTTLRVLPSKIRTQIGLAYLLARASDTIADTTLVPVDKRLRSLQDLRERIRGSQSVPLDFGEMSQRQNSQAERILLENVEASLALLRTLPSADRELIQEVLDTITNGQELDLTRFGSASPERLAALRTDDELDDYTYRVAGCVGEFWTKMCRVHLFPHAALDDALLLANGVRFGKGLQLVNILRDLPEDLRAGRCYLPRERLSALGLEPEDLFQPGNEPRFRPLFHSYLTLCESHLSAGWAYTIALPRRSVRVRLACAWPILIGLETVKLLRTGNILDSARRIKVSRQSVKKIFRRSLLLYPFPRAWTRLAMPKAIAPSLFFT